MYFSSKQNIFLGPKKKGVLLLGEIRYVLEYVKVKV